MEEQSKKRGGVGNPFSALTERLNIRGKLMLAFLVMITLTLVVIAIATVSQRFATKTIDELVQTHGKVARLSLETDKKVKEMSIHEKDFLLNYNKIGITEAKNLYLNRFIAAGGEAYQILYAIQQVTPDSQEQDNAQKAIDAINNYVATFMSTVNILERQVNPEFGELAKLRQSLAALQNTVGKVSSTKFQGDLQNLLLRTQDYTFAQSKQAAEKVQSEIKKFTDTIRTSNESQTNQAELLTGIVDFGKWFNEVVQTDEGISSQILSYQEAVRRATPILQTFLNNAIEKERQAALRMENAADLVQKIVIGVGLLAVAIGLLIAFLLSNGLTRQINLIMDLLGDMGMGNFQARAEVVSKDELGQMATALNAMLDNITVLIQSQEERDSIQESIMKLMGEISDLTEGDLTARAEVTEDVTGAIADSFNAMAEQFGEIVRQVKATTFSVDETAADVGKLTTELAVKSQDQTKRVNEAIQAIHEMAASIRQVSENALLSAQVSETSRNNAREGAEAVEKTNRAMDEIREQINETARSIKRLGESSMEIGNVVEIINNIADRTSILALNASIQAAMAGDAGFGFAVVAEEVQRLAESSSNSTKQIDMLVRSIQSEIKDVSNRMDESISKVVQGSRLADGAHEKLQQIETVSNQLADLIEAITQAAATQVQVSERVVDSMVSVGGVSSETSKTSQETADLMKLLNATAGKLREAVEVFKVESAQFA